MLDFPNNRKVLIAIPVLFVGGTEIYTLNLVKALASGGYHVSICCYYDYESTMLSKLKGEGAHVFLLRLKPPDGLFTLLTKLVPLFKNMKPDIVHVQYIAPGLIPIIAARLAGVKRVFATVHQPGRTYGLKAKLLIRIAAYLCGGFFCNSRSVEESWFGDSQVFDPEKINSKRKHFTIYNGVDIERIERIGRELDKEEIKNLLGVRDRKIVGVVGRLRNEKGQATLLDSMKTVKRELPESVLLVVGDGPDRPYLEEMAKKFGLDSHVKWLGQKDHGEVLRLYNIMDVVVVPSVFEGFGLTAAEAMAAGKPVVASYVDGLSEVVQNEMTGLLVPPNNKKAFSEAIVRLLSNPGRAALMGAHGREFIRKNFSLELFRSTILDAYNHFLQV